MSLELNTHLRNYESFYTDHRRSGLHVRFSKHFLSQANGNCSGGSVLADLISRKSGPISESRIYAIVRSDEQVQSLSKLDRVNPIQLDLNNEVAVTEAVLDSKIDIVLHLASSLEQKFVTNLINALGERRKSSGEDVFFVHVRTRMTSHCRRTDVE